MSFSTEIKNEVCSLKLSRVENISFLSGFVRNNKLENVNVSPFTFFYISKLFILL